ncbi:MAG: SRPBCC family protein [Pyrinomonadaceae bacterium]
MNDYEFVTVWRFDSPVEPVWNEIRNTVGWSHWWRGVVRVEELKKGDPDGLGAIHRSTWKSALPYKLVFDSEVVRIEPLKLIEARAFGQLEGRGLWQFTIEEEDLTRVQYDWQVKTNKAWMNLIAPVARPFFRWNHDIIMNWGGEGLAKKLKCKLI